MSNSPTAIPLTVAELRINPSIAPGGALADSLVTAYGPLVFGVARAFIPGDEEAQKRVARVVFHSFALVWRKCSKKTVVAMWLLQSTRFAAMRERAALGLPTVKKGQPHVAIFRFCRELGLQDPRRSGAFVLRAVCQLPAAAIAGPLKHSEAKVEKITARGVKAVAWRLRRTKAQVEAVTWLQALSEPLPADLQESLGAELKAWLPEAVKTPAMKGVLLSWKFYWLRGVLRHVAISVGVSFFCMALFGFTMHWLWDHGYLSRWAMRRQGVELAKQMPELAVPARPWPVTAEDWKLVTTNKPANSSELYRLTNIWLVTLRYSAEDWEGMEPVNIPPGGDMQPDGSKPLRNPNAKRSGLTGMAGLEFNWTRATMIFGGEEFPVVGVRHRGNGTYFNSLFGPKQSIKIDMNKHTKGQTLAGVKTLNLLNSIPDFSYLHDSLGEQMFRDMGVPGPRSAYAYVTVDVPGKYTNQAFGLYVLMENPDAVFAAERLGEKKTPIFKPVTPKVFEDMGNDWKDYAPTYDLKTKATDEQLRRVVDFSKLVSHADDAEFARRLPEFLDIEEFAGFVGGHVLMSSFDGFLANGQNFYVYLDPKSNRFGFIPWDQDHSWGEFGYVGTAERREKASIWDPATYDFKLLYRVMKVEAFRVAYRQRLETALEKFFTVERLNSQIDQVAAIIRPAIAAENEFRLKRFDLSVTNKWVEGPRDGGEREGPRSPVHQMKRFIVNRAQSVREQLDGKSEGEKLRRH